MKQHTQFSNGKRMAMAVLVSRHRRFPGYRHGQLVHRAVDVVYGRILGVDRYAFLVTSDSWSGPSGGQTGRISSSRPAVPANKESIPIASMCPRALAMGLAASDRSVTLAAAATTNLHLSIWWTSAGDDPRSRGPTFDANQLQRAATYRMTSC